MCRQLLLELDNALRLLHDDGGTQFLGQVLTLNLDLLATTLAAGLEEVGTGALHGCDQMNIDVNGTIRKAYYLLETCVLAWKARKMSGSIMMAMSRLAMSFSLRVSILFCTQSAKGRPTSVYVTLMTHYLGSLRRSSSSGK